MGGRRRSRSPNSPKNQPADPIGTGPQNILLRGLRTVDRGLTVTENVLLGIAAVGLAATMILIFYSAISRYLFSSPVSGSNVWVAEFLAPMITFFALGAAFRLRRHIGVTFIVRALTGPWRLATQSLAALLTAGIFCLVGYEGTQRAVAAYTSDQMSSVGAPLFLAYAVVPIGSFLLTARALELCLRWWAGDRTSVCLSELHESRVEQ